MKPTANRWKTGRHWIVSVGVGMLLPWVALAAESFTPDQIQEILAEFRSYDHGQDPTLQHTIARIVQFLGHQPRLRLFTETQMIALLESEASTPAAKQFICQQLWIIGSDASLPVLETMLRDKGTAEMACYALRTNPSQAVDRALRRALDEVPEETQEWIINVLGDREDVGSVEQLVERLGAENVRVAEAAARALGKIGGPRATEAIRTARATASGDRHAVLTETYLNCAESHARNRQPAQALAIYTALLDESEPLLTRRAALVGALHTSDPRAVDLMTAAIQRDEPMLRATAVANSTALKGAEVTAKLIAVLETAPPFTQVQMIEVLIQRDDPRVKDAITAAAGSRDAPVRMAAFNALAEVGDASTVAVLCQALERAQTRDEGDAILASLRRLEGEAVSRAILDALEDAPPATKSQLVNILTQRGYRSAIPQLLDLARREEPAVAATALRAVGTLGSVQDLPQLLEVLAEGQDQTVPAEALQAATAVIGRSAGPRDEIAQLIQRRLDSTVDIPARCLLLRLLSAVPHATSLQRLKAASQDGNPSVRDAAIRALAEYPNPAAIDELVLIYQTASNSTHRAVALRGCVELLKTDTTTPQRAVAVYGQLAARASTPAEKRLLLSGLAMVHHPKAGEIIERFTDDETVKAEAALALAANASTPGTVNFNDEPTALNGKVGDAKLVDSPIASKALSLDGRDARLELPRSDAWSVGAGDFTVALWVRPAALKQAGLLCVGGYGWRHGWLVDVHPDGSVRLETSNASREHNGSIRTPGGMVSKGRWTHIAVTVSRGEAGARIFINGREQAAGRIGDADLTNPEANVVIGGIENANPHNFHGEIDEVTIRKRVLSMEEIQALIEPGRELTALSRAPAR